MQAQHLSFSVDAPPSSVGRRRQKNAAFRRRLAKRKERARRQALKVRLACGFAAAAWLVVLVQLIF